MSTMKKDLRKLVPILEQVGGSVTSTRGNHLRWVFPDGGIYVTSGNPTARYERVLARRVHTAVAEYRRGQANQNKPDPTQNGSSSKAHSEPERIQPEPTEQPEPIEQPEQPESAESEQPTEGAEVTEYRCEECDRLFQTEQGLNAHSQHHQGPTPERVAEMFIELRKCMQEGHTQVQICEAIGMSTATFNRAENTRNLSQKTADKIENYLKRRVRRTVPPRVPSQIPAQVNLETAAEPIEPKVQCTCEAAALLALLREHLGVPDTNEYRLRAERAEAKLARLKASLDE